MGNGAANIVAALIIAAAILWNGGVGQKNHASATLVTEADFAKWYARAVGDIRNDVVVNCGCCGDAKKTPAPEKRQSF